MVHIYDKLHAVEFDKLPKSIQGVYLAPPVISVPVEQDGEGFYVLEPATLDRPALQTLTLLPQLKAKTQLTH